MQPSFLVHLGNPEFTSERAYSEVSSSVFILSLKKVLGAAKSQYNGGLLKSSDLQLTCLFLSPKNSQTAYRLEMGFWAH